MTARDRTGAAALVGAAVTGLIAFALFLAGGLLLWANGHYKDADGYLSTGSQRFDSPEYAITTPNLESAPARPASCSRPTATATIRLPRRPRAASRCSSASPAPATSTPTCAASRTARSPTSTTRRSSARYTQHPRHAQARPRPPTQPSGPRAARTRCAGTSSRGDWSVVVMNADGSRGVSAAVSAGAKVPYIAEFGYGALGLGLLFIIATAALTRLRLAPGRAPHSLSLSARARRRPPATRRARPALVRVHEPPAGERLQLARRPDRQQRAGDREAAVLERDERARLVAPRAQLLDHAMPGDLRRARGSPSPSSHGRIDVTDGRLRGRGRGRSREPDRPGRASARISSRNSTATSWRTSTCSWSPASTIVEPRGGIARSPRTITFSSASRGSPSSRTGWPTTASPSRTGNCIVSAPSRFSSTGSTSGAGIAASSEVTPSQRATGSIVSPCSDRREQHDEERDVEDQVAVRDALGHREGGEHDRASRRAGPAQPSISRSRQREPGPSATSSAASGRATTRGDDRDRRALERDVDQLAPGTRAARAAGTARAARPRRGPRGR